MGFKYISLDKSGRFPKLRAVIAKGIYAGTQISVDLVPVFPIKSPIPHKHVLYAVTKDSLQNKSMPLDFSQYIAQIIRNMPDYMREGIKRVKKCRLSNTTCDRINANTWHFSKSSDIDENEYIDSKVFSFDSCRALQDQPKRYYALRPKYLLFATVS